MLYDVMSINYFVFEMQSPLDLMFKRNRIFNSRSQTVVLLVGVKLTFECLADFLDTVLKHSYKILDCLVFRGVKMQGEQSHFELLVCAS